MEERYPELIDPKRRTWNATPKIDPLSTRARSALAGLDKLGAQVIPNKEPTKTPKLSRMAPVQPARAQSNGPRPGPGMINPRIDVRPGQGEVPGPMGHRQNSRHQLTSSMGIHNSPLQASNHASESQRSPDRRRRVDRCKGKAHVEKGLPDHELSNSNHAPSRTGGKGNHNRHCHKRSISSDSHTRDPSYRHDMTSQRLTSRSKDRLRHATMPRGFRKPKFKTFSGFGDPNNHIKSFDSHISFWASEEEVYARAFPNSLSGQTLKWFHKLPPNSIDCWQDIVDIFMEKFGASIIADADERTLMKIQQKPGETLRIYATRFEEVATNIPTANENVTMISFFYGLRWPLKEKLVLEPPGMRNELSKLVIQYIKMEERPHLRSPRREDLRAPRRHPNPVVTNYTPRPQKIKAPPNRRDLRKYCEYHKDHGHDTDESRILKAEIEKLIKRG
ncbi:hypothetical protein LIER_01964 [Lithospermum erythrorhizon]|uniref:Retrotransposon gag domain-containing protein n=1 Tax=Lithospermum erythrorhizon TaxID=34254 RepID=A0AAV3NP36_LITER